MYYQREIALLKQENANYRLKLETRGGEEMNVRQVIYSTIVKHV